MCKFKYIVVVGGLLALSLCLPAEVSAQVTIHSKFKAYTLEEMLEPYLIYQQAYNKVMSSIDDLMEYIMEILGQEISSEMREDMNRQYKILSNVAENLSKTGDLALARSGYNTVLKNVRQRVVTYNNQVAKERQRIEAERRRTIYEASKPKSKSVAPSLWSGSGFALKNGYICTNYHVIEGANSIEIFGVRGDFTISHPAKVIATDKYNDLAVLKIDEDEFKGFGSIPYRVKTSIADVGEEVFVLGYPLTATMGEEIKLTTGVVSSRTGYKGDVALYQISAPIQPGNSGGPLFDSQGNLIGVVSAKHTEAENVGYAVKASYLSNLIESSIPMSILPINNQISDAPLVQKIKNLKNFVFMIVCSVHSNDIVNPSFDRSSKGIIIKRVQIRNNQTIIDIEYDNAIVGAEWLNIDSNTYIRTLDANGNTITLSMIKAEGIPVAPQKHYFDTFDEKVQFKLIFPALPSGTLMFNLIENVVDGFKCYGIRR